MNNVQGRMVTHLVVLTSVFVILFGIRGSAYMINPIQLAAIITMTVLLLPSA